MKTETESRTSKDEFVAVWRQQRLKAIGVFSIFIVGGIIGFFVVGAIGRGEQSNPVSRLMNLVAMGAVVFALGLGVWKVLSNAAKLMLGPPKAATTPEESLKKFYSASLVAAGSLDQSKVQADALAYLHPDAVARIGGWSGFEQHWVSANTQVVEYLRTICKSPLTQSRFEIRDVRKLASGNGSNRFQVTLAFTVISGVDNPGFSRATTLGPWLYTAEHEMLNDDGRWYLAAAEWAGVPQQPAQPSEVQSKT
jgi:hypothetical protein